MINLVIMAQCLKPFCAEKHRLKSQFLHGIIPESARTGLEKEKIDSLEKLSCYSEKEILQLHGFGKITMLKLKNYMKENHISFK